MSLNKTYNTYNNWSYFVILIEAMDAGIITEAEGNTIWAGMIRKRRTHPTATFSDYLANFLKTGEAKS